MSRPDSTRRLRRGLLFVAVAAALPFAPAHAQLGRLVKKAAAAAAANKAQDAASDATGGAVPQSEARASAPIAISSQSIDQLLAALGPQVAAASKYDAARQAYEAHETRYRRHTACRDTIKRAQSDVPLIPTKQQLEQNVEYGNKVAAIMERYAADQQAGRTDAAQRMLDSAGVVGEDMENNLMPALKKCGAYVSKPGARPKPPESSELGGVPPIPAGMTATQFGRLRERVAAWLVTDGQYKVGPEEHTALEARKKDLAPLTPLFRGNALYWQHWGDLTNPGPR